MPAEIVDEKYMILNNIKLRSGAHSTVRKAIDIGSGQELALKFIVGRSDEMTQLIFEREADALNKLSHPNIVPLVAQGIDETGTPYLVLPWVETSYRDVLDKGIQGLPDEVLRKIVLPLVSALSQAHLSSVIHRDVKPGNILVTAEGTPLLADFSIGKNRVDHVNTDSNGMTMRAWKTNLYAPPEMTDDFPYTRDVFSIAVVFIESIAAVPPVDHFQLETALENAALPQMIKELFSRCISLDPSVRPSSGAVLLEELEASIAESFPAQRSPHRIWLTLKESVQRSLEASATGSVDGQNLLATDLSNGGHILFKWDKKSQTLDKEILELAGDAFIYILKPDKAGNFMIISARQTDFETLEWIRRNGVATADLGTFLLLEPLDKSAARNTQDFILDQIRRHHEESKSAQEDVQANALLDRWSNLLDARRALERMDRSNIKFTNSEHVGKDIKLTVADATTKDLLNTDWILKTHEETEYGPRVQIVRHQGDTINVRRRTQRSASIPRQGVLVPHLGATQVAMKRQSDAIRTLKRGESAHSELLSILVDPSIVRPPEAQPDPIWQSELDPAKQTAVKASLGLMDAMVVKGPPGTGKTRFITEAINQLLDRNPEARILVVSQTHVAVDNALERLDAAGIENIVRLGNQDDVRISKNVGQLLLDRKMTQWANEVQLAAAEFMAALSSQAGIPIADLHSAVLLEQLVALKRRRKEAEARIPLEPVTETYELTADLTAARDAVVLQEELDHLVEDEDQLWHQLDANDSENLLVDRSSTIDDLETLVEIILGTDQRGSELLALLKLQADWLQRISTDSSLIEAYLQTANVVAGTCLGFVGHPAARDLTFDLCILDEASKATATEALVPLVKARKFILVGDGNQLPPMEEELLRQTDLMEEYALSRDLVTETLFERLTSQLPSHSQFLLTDQYRMTRAIGDMISECFYDGKLKSVSDQVLPGFSTLNRPVFWLDTSKAGARRREEIDPTSRGSYFNRFEAHTVNEQLKKIDRAIEMGIIKLRDGSEKLSVLLIAPYRSQLDTLKREVAGWVPKHLDLSIESIDAVQGKESDLAFVTVTRNNSGARFGFIGPDYWRRINVAMSRARYGLTIVGDTEFCRRKPGPLADILSYMANHSEDCEVRKVDAPR